MAVQQNKKSHSRKGMRRSHDRVAIPTITTCACGDLTIPHSICATCGSYKGRQIIKPKNADQ